jgi:hypothetical protein
MQIIMSQRKNIAEIVHAVLVAVILMMPHILASLMRQQSLVDGRKNPHGRQERGHDPPFHFPIATSRDLVMMIGPDGRQGRLILRKKKERLLRIDE